MMRGQILARSVAVMSLRKPTDGQSGDLTGTLSSWRDGPAKQAILAFVAATCGQDGSEPVPVEERVAVFDNDGTLWCEKPVPIQMDFILRRFVEMAKDDPALRDRMPFRPPSSTTMPGSAPRSRRTTRATMTR